MSNNLTLVIDLCNQNKRLPTNIEAEIFSSDNKLIHYYLDKLGVDKNNCIARRLYFYARDVIKDRWLVTEHIIAKDARFAYFYAIYVMRDRWPEAEPIIATNAEYAYFYAVDIIQDRFIEAEHIIAKDVFWLDQYCDYFNILESDLCQTI